MEQKIAWVVEKTNKIYTEFLDQSETQEVGVIVPFDDPDFYQIFLIIDHEPFTKFRGLHISDEIILYKYHTVI